MSCEIVFRVASESEHEQVREFLREFFFADEPINNAHPIRDESEEEEFILSLLPKGNIIFAIDSINDRVAGLASVGEITKNYAQETWAESETTTNQKWRDVLKFMSHIDSKSDVCKRFDVTSALHLHGVTVDKRYRGKAIGKLLFKECFNLAKHRDYRLVSADCTSVYSIRIAEAVGMKCVSTVTYEEYNDKIGEKIFQPISPHTEIKTFVKKI